MVKQAMNTVKLQSYSWISNTLGISDNKSNILKKKVKAGSTLGALLTELANSYPEFRKMVFSPDTGKMSDQVLVIINNRLVQYGEIMETKISDKDTIVLAPVIFGG
jgi:molybdopterin converting factor small subunit